MAGLVSPQTAHTEPAREPSLVHMFLLCSSPQTAARPGDDGHIPRLHPPSSPRCQLLHGFITGQDAQQAACPERARHVIALHGRKGHACWDAGRRLSLAWAVLGKATVALRPCMQPRQQPPLLPGSPACAACRLWHSCTKQLPSQPAPACCLCAGTQLAARPALRGRCPSATAWRGPRAGRQLLRVSGGGGRWAGSGTEVVGGRPLRPGRSSWLHAVVPA